MVGEAAVGEDPGVDPRDGASSPARRASPAKPVTAATSVTGRPASRSARAVPPVETSSKPRVDEAAARARRGRSCRRPTGGPGAGRAAARLGAVDVDRDVPPVRPRRRPRRRASSATARGRRRCSTARIRSWSVASSSPARIATASWATIGPPSSVSSTRWTVAPVTVDARGRARRGPRARRGTPAGATGGCSGSGRRTRRAPRGPTIRM